MKHASLKILKDGRKMMVDRGHMYQVSGDSDKRCSKVSSVN